jgi:cytochrome c553
MKNITKYKGEWYVLVILILSACTYDVNPLPPGPPIPEETTNLEAEYVSAPPSSINSPFWRTADYVVSGLENISTGEVNPADGALNTNGMLSGLTDFNKGDSSGIIIKAAYDDENLYILTEWTDNSYQGYQLNWLYNGPKDPTKPAEDSAGWTSQKNDDNLIFDFDAGNSTRDIWKWSLALSEPLGYAFDMYDNGSGEVTDNGDWTLERNSAGGTNRSGPAYEWSGEVQEVERALIPVTRLDPALYLFSTKTFEGDVEQGELLYQAECASCHGSTGNGLSDEQGGFDSFVPMTDPTLNRKDPSAFEASLSASQHSGNSYWNGLTAEEKTDVIARIRGFAGIPGYVLNKSAGTDPDVIAISDVNVALVDIKSRDKTIYKVLMVRPLVTNKSDDVQFTLSEQREFSFNIYLTDDDSENRVGITDKTLIFK